MVTSGVRHGNAVMAGRCGLHNAIEAEAPPAITAHVTYGPYITMTSLTCSERVDPHNRRMIHAFAIVTTLLAAAAFAVPAQARTVYRCERDGTPSLATAPEPGSRCVAREIDDNAAALPNIWGVNGKQTGALYARLQDGKTVYSTRELPGSTRVLAFTVAPPDLPPHLGLGRIGKPRLDVHAPIFVAAARANAVDDALLRAVAHAESGFRADAVSPKGAQGVMQLMPSTAAMYDVGDAFSARESIGAGARHLSKLMVRYHGNRRLAAAAYNAGEGAVARYDGVPPFPETQAYVAKVEALYASYRIALAAGAAAATRGLAGQVIAR